MDSQTENELLKKQLEHLKNAYSSLEQEKKYHESVAHHYRAILACAGIHFDEPVIVCEEKAEPSTHFHETQVFATRNNAQLQLNQPFEQRMRATSGKQEPRDLSTAVGALHNLKRMMIGSPQKPDLGDIPSQRTSNGSGVPGSSMGLGGGNRFGDGDVVKLGSAHKEAGPHQPSALGTSVSGYGQMISTHRSYKSFSDAGSENPDHCLQGPSSQVANIVEPPGAVSGSVNQVSLQSARRFLRPRVVSFDHVQLFSGFFVEHYRG